MKTKPENYPTISIIIPTYNRAGTLPRAIDSVLKQDYDNWELVIVDDGSMDNTSEILAGYRDSRITVIKHAQNQGVTAAENTGLDAMHGTWFTLLGSDDEIIPTGLSAMLKVTQMDPSLDAITCNCINSVTGQFSGLGLNHDQYLGFETMVRYCSGEHWGITKSALLEGRRFNEQIPSENILWYKISKQAKRYYLHQGLRIYHTEGDDRISNATFQKSLKLKKRMFRALLDEKEYIEILERYCPSEYIVVMFNIALVSILDKRRRDAIKAYRALRRFGAIQRSALILSGLIFGPWWMEKIYELLTNLRFRKQVYLDAK